MKGIINIKSLILSGAMLMTAGLTSCEDFLTIYPTGQITEENYWQDRTDLEAVLYSGYYQLSSADVVGKMIRWGECRSDNFSVRDLSNTSLNNLQSALLLPTDGEFSWAGFYKGINYCNSVLEHGDLVVSRDPSYTAEEWSYDRAEMIGLRALYYFYLIRAFGDVPEVFEAVTTDEQALQRFDAQTNGLVLLSRLISEVDSVKDRMRTNLGNTTLNKGRLTRKGVYALLADMYLWRASKLMATTETDVTKDTVNTEQSNADFQKVIELCDYVINDTYKDINVPDFTGSSLHLPSLWLVSKYPLNYFVLVTDGATDYVNSDIFGTSNSYRESVFELQYDGSKRTNSALGSYYYAPGASTVSGSVVANPSFYSRPSEIAPTKGYGLTDFRYRYNVYLNQVNQTEFPIVKYVCSSNTVPDVDNVAEGPATTTYTLKTASSTTAGWIIYRMSDLMLMKAEAIARTATTNSDLMREGFNLTNALYARSNPAADSTGSSQANNTIKTDRLTKNYFYNKTASQLLDLVYNERQREFFAEGKRWFDLVRLAEANGSTTASLNYMGATRAIKIRLRLMKSFYNPVQSDQIKINPNLVQNPVWNTTNE